MWTGEEFHKINKEAEHARAAGYGKERDMHGAHHLQVCYKYRALYDDDPAFYTEQVTWFMGGPCDACGAPGKECETRWETDFHAAEKMINLLSGDTSTNPDFMGQHALPGFAAYMWAQTKSDSWKLSAWEELLLWTQPSSRVIIGLYWERDYGRKRREKKFCSLSLSHTHTKVRAGAGVGARRGKVWLRLPHLGDACTCPEGGGVHALRARRPSDHRP